MIQEKIIRDGFYWVFFIFYMYESYLIFFKDETIPQAINNLVMGFAPAVLIYIYAVFHKNFYDDTQKDGHNDK